MLHLGREEGLNSVVKCRRIPLISVVLYCFPCIFGCCRITGYVNEMFRKVPHDGCFGCTIVAGLCGETGSMSGLASQSIYVLVDIHYMNIDRDLVAPSVMECLPWDLFLGHVYDSVGSRTTVGWS